MRGVCVCVFLPGQPWLSINLLFMEQSAVVSLPPSGQRCRQQTRLHHHHHHHQLHRTIEAHYISCTVVFALRSPCDSRA